MRGYRWNIAHHDPVHKNSSKLKMKHDDGTGGHKRNQYFKLQLDDGCV
jgi:hypothetical protein